MRNASICAMEGDFQRLGIEEATQMGKIHCDPKVKRLLK